MQKSIDSLLANRETEKAIDMLRKHVQSYSNLDQLGFRTLQLAGMLHQTGRSAEALAFLESFAVYKPAVNFWIDSANTLYDKITKSNREEVMQQISPEKLEIINSLTAQIRNLKLTNSNPALITNLADSLRFMAPGDSILIWLEKQLPSQSESSDSFCEEQRKLAAEKFANSRKNKAKTKALLTEAVEALDKCLARTPSADMRKKVTQNREVISKELRMEN
jgi:tetratricopeptide (TPR) repeat protein